MSCDISLQAIISNSALAKLIHGWRPHLKFGLMQSEKNKIRNTDKQCIDTVLYFELFLIQALFPTKQIASPSVKTKGL